MCSCIYTGGVKNYYIESITLIFVTGYFFIKAEPWFVKFGISHILDMAPWFCTGLLMAKYYTELHKLYAKKIWQIAVLAIALFAGQIFLLNIRSMYLSHIYNTLIKMMLCIVGIMFVWTISIIITQLNKCVIIRKLFEWFGRESMTIYLLSYFVQTPGVTVYSKLGNLGIPYIIWVAGLAVGSVVFAVLASKLVVSKSKLLSKLMIGA